MKTCCIVLLEVLLMAGVVSGQEARPPAVLMTGEDGKSSPLGLDEVDVRVLVTGNVAETVMTMRFRNETDRVLEGELVFPLGEGRTVSRYALEVNGKMREGVAIPKTRGRVVFESVVRKEIDPGLLEWTKGNNFRTRVYPIPANGFKSVRVGYEEVLAEEDGKYVYRLPLDYKEAVGLFRMRVEVERTRMAVNDIEVEGLKFQRRKARTVVMEAEEKGFTANGPVVVRLAREQEPSVLVEEKDGNRFFHVVDRPMEREELVDAMRGGEAGRPSSIRLVWDASNSGEARDTAKELEVLGRYLGWAGDVSVTLQWLRNDLEAGGEFVVKGGEWGALRKVLEGVRYDGGTRMGLLDFREMKEEVAVLVSDGVSTLGSGGIAVGTKPVMVLHGAQSAEHGTLRSVSTRSGGVYVNLAARSSDEGLAMLAGRRFSLLSVEVPEGAAVTEVYPAMKRVVSGPMTVSGKMKGEQPVTLVLRYGFGEEVAMTTEVVVDPVAHASRSGRVSRLWAQMKLRDLEVDAERNREAILELAKAQGLVTRFTSLIVLDRIEDYVEHRIVPPEAEMRKEYEELLKEAPDPDRGNPEHMKEMLALWKDRCDWHGKKFPGLGELLFKRFDEAKKEIQEVRRELKDLKKEDLEEFDEEEKKLFAKVTEKMAEFDDLKAAMRRLSQVPEKKRDVVWQRELEAVGVRFGELMDVLEEVGMGAAPQLPNSVGGGGGAADPFSAPATNEPPAPAPVPEAASDPFGGGGGEAAPEREVGDAAMNGMPARKGGAAGGEAVGSITLAEWDPKTPYLEALKKAADADLVPVYFKWKETSADSSAFYLDVADFFLERKQEKLALRILTNVAEMDLESVPLLRILGHRLDQLGELELAELVFREVKELRGDEPQSWRDLALVLEKRGQFQEAFDLMWSMVMFEWDSRFPEIQMIALMELNALVARQGENLDLSAVDERFLKNLDCDVRIVLTWDADNTDMDLWVTGPAGEKCYYGEADTMTGGHMSEDFTEGYGPEEFVIRKALKGNYKVEVDYFGNQQQVLAGATTVQAVLITNWGRSNEKRQAVTLRLKDEEEMVKVGVLRFGGD